MVLGFAHPPLGMPWADLATRWTMDPLVLASLTTSVALYAYGTCRVWQRAGIFNGVRVWQVNCFGAGIVTLIVALLSPLDALSDALFAAHMTQHELLMIVAAPLLVAGRPLVAMLWALPRGARELVGHWVAVRPVARFWSFITGPVCVLLVHGLVLWLWHIPQLFEAALHSEPIHAVQHLMFFVTAALFWWALVHGRYGRAGYGVSVLFVFATALHTSILGALLAVGQRIWYPAQSQQARLYGLDPIEDQELAGLIMWVPSGIVFVVIALALFAAWLGEAGKRVRRLELGHFAGLEQPKGGAE